MDPANPKTPRSQYVVGEFAIARYTVSGVEEECSYIVTVSSFFETVASDKDARGLFSSDRDCSISACLKYVCVGLQVAHHCQTSLTLLCLVAGKKFDIQVRCFLTS